MTDRALVQNALPIIDVTLPDGTVQQGIAVQMNATVDNGVVENKVTPTVGIVTNYTVGDAVGGKLTFPLVLPAAGNVEIDSIVVANLASTLLPMLDLVLFSADFTPTADNSPFTIADADLLNVIGVLALGGWDLNADNATSQRLRIAMACAIPGTSLYGQLVTRNSFNHFVTVSDLQVALRTKGA